MDVILKWRSSVGVFSGTTSSHYLDHDHNRTFKECFVARGWEQGFPRGHEGYEELDINMSLHEGVQLAENDDVGRAAVVGAVQKPRWGHSDFLTKYQRKF